MDEELEGGQTHLDRTKFAQHMDAIYTFRHQIRVHEFPQDCCKTISTTVAHSPTGSPISVPMSETPISIAIMGATGSGKSTFINLASGSNLLTSELLGSCTQNVQGPEFRLDGRKIKLIDTPGFDDTDRSEVHILQLIANFLVDQYRSGIVLHGIIYLHRISDIRMGGVSIRTLNVFRKICGSRSLKNVAIVTNKWSKDVSVEEQNRERQLQDDERFFKPYLDDHATMYRHDNTAESTHKIIRDICSREPFPLDIQLEMVDQKKSLQDTSAGKALYEALEELVQGLSKETKNLREGIDEAVRQGDGSTRVELAHVLRLSEGELTRVQNEVKNLKTSTVAQTDIDVDRQWRQMSLVTRVAILFRRSQGATDSREVDNFWLALGDTITTVKELRAIFDEHPLPLSLRRQLLESTRVNQPDLERWVRRNREAVTEMENLVERAIRNLGVPKSKPKNKIWRRLYFMLTSIPRVTHARNLPVY